jgi:beta-glucanase (GH16 family)
MNTTRTSVRLLPVLGLMGCVLAGPASTSAADTPATTQTLAVPADYKLAWADEFNTPGLPDPANWSYDTARNKAGWYNNELQYYSAARPENSEVRDGKLIITARKETLRSKRDWGGQRYSSARLFTSGKHEWTYGFFSVRAKLPCGPGTWPAIWLLGSTGDWPARGELDMMEQFGNDPGRILSTTHTTAASGDKGIGGSTRQLYVCEAFHDYQMLWTPEEIRFGIDGKQHFVYRNEGKGKAQWPYDAPEFLLLNFAIGGSLGGPVDEKLLPATMEVDYVRVWQKP